MTKKNFVLFIALLCFSPLLRAQLFSDSNLPIVIISTINGDEIPDAPRVVATMKIIYGGPGQRNYLSDAEDPAKLNYDGKIRIEIRGSSSQALPKKQYGLSTVQADNVTNNNVSLLGMPRENDWVLNGLAFDASLVRDYLTYNLAWQTGNYASRQRYCDVIINNDYKGLYILQEKIKIDDNRVDVQKITNADNTFPDVSGGYLTKADKVADDDVSAWTMQTHLGTFTDFIHESPDRTEITNTQSNYIWSVFNTLAMTASNDNVTKGYPSVIDVPSFVDFILLNEISANVDAYQFSTFFHKDRKGKLRAGPLWDSNLTYGNDLTFWGLDRSKTDSWQFNNGDNVGPRFWKDLFNNPKFRCYLSRRWNELTQPGQPLNQESIGAFLDQTVLEIAEATVREEQRWGTVGDHSQQIAGIKNFLAIRIPWMTTQLGSFNSCASVFTPPLVISRIHYHPETRSEFPDDDDLEFIEIVNNSDEPVALTGIYFGGTGIGYQFPQGMLEGRGVIQIANDRVTFERKHGYFPFGEFARNLSNDSQALILSDAFGNVIDRVVYDDASPWPAADGTGSYLKLTDLSLDNADAASWTASTEALTATVVVGLDEEADFEIEVFPNPSETSWNVRSPEIIRAVALSSAQGREVLRIPVNARSTTISASGFTSGIYLLTIETVRGIIVRKVVRR